MGPAVSRLHEHLASTNYRNPQDSLHTSFQTAQNTPDHWWEWLQKRPRYAAQFNNHMTGTQAEIQPWIDSEFYPFQERLISGADQAEDAVFLVDVGSGKGHDVQEVLRQHPELPGILILQDQKEVIDEVTGLDPRIQATVHDFFTPQPIKGSLPPPSHFSFLSLISTRMVQP